MRDSVVRPRLAVSVFNAEEVRAAVAGGADIIDCEDPRSSLGMFEPRVVTDIGYAVRQSAGARAIPTSANIGIPQQLKGQAAREVVRRSQLEVQAKAAQEALGLAAAMDVDDARPNVIKFEVDGLPDKDVGPYVDAVKRAVRRSRRYQNHRVVASCLELDRHEWERRRLDSSVIRELLQIGEFYFDARGEIDLKDYLTPEQVADLVSRSTSSDTHVSLFQPTDPERLGLPADPSERLHFLVTTVAQAGADAVMIDTPVQAKVAGICLLIDEPAEQVPSTDSRHGTFAIETLKRFSEDCAYNKVECWLAGSINAKDAGRLAELEDVDVIMCRGAASAQVRNPFGAGSSQDRAERRINAAKVRELAIAVRGPFDGR
jgi:uncharacterized protein (UPF0264 family)